MKPSLAAVSTNAVANSCAVQRMINARHGGLHRLHIYRGLQKHDNNKLLDTAMAVLDTFVDHFESEESMRFTDRV